MAFHGGITVEKENMAEEDNLDDCTHIADDNQSQHSAEGNVCPSSKVSRAGTFNLSEKSIHDGWTRYYPERDVREFIKLLKKHLVHSLLPGGLDEMAAKKFYLQIIEPIDKLAGKSLV